jgi:anti-sigma B factor antagonist
MALKLIKKDNSAGVLVLPDSVMREDVGELKLLANKLLEEGLKRVILDFSGVKRIDSQGLGQIVSFHISMQKSQVECSIAGMKDSIRELFSITNLDRVIDIHDSVEQAMQAPPKVDPGL